MTDDIYCSYNLVQPLYHVVKLMIFKPMKWKQQFKCAFKELATQKPPNAWIDSDYTKGKHVCSRIPSAEKWVRQKYYKMSLPIWEPNVFCQSAHSVAVLTISSIFMVYHLHCLSCSTWWMS